MEILGSTRGDAVADAVRGAGVQLLEYDATSDAAARVGVGRRVRGAARADRGAARDRARRRGAAVVAGAPAAPANRWWAVRRMRLRRPRQHRAMPGMWGRAGFADGNRRVNGRAARYNGAAFTIAQTRPPHATPENTNHASRHAAARAARVCRWGNHCGVGRARVFVAAAGRVGAGGEARAVARAAG